VAPYLPYADNLNDAGDAVGGSSALGTGAVHAILWKGSQVIDLPTLGGSINQALAINDSDVIVGTSSLPNGDVKPVEWANGILHQLGNLGGSYAIPNDINSSGVIVGNASTHAGANHVVEWNDGKVLDLGAGQVGSINNEGQVVGSLGNSATLWENGERINLNTVLPANSGWNLFSAIDINDGGQIIGDGEYHGQERGFLLTPITTSSPGANTIPLPDPAAAGLIVSPLVIFAMRRSMRKQAAY
jgi:probable HAF family extracellular repeat protein